MVLFPEEEAVRDRIVQACIDLSKEISRQGVNPTEGPDTLYHYTSGQGLIGILTNSEIWLSRAVALNDPGELAYGKRIARQVLGARFELIGSGGRDDLRKAFHDCLIERLSGPNQLRHEWVGDEIRLDPFVACFCEAPDLLSQWNYYAREGGYCVGFRRDRLISANQLTPPQKDAAEPEASESFELCPVIYEPERQRELIDDAAHQFEELLIREVSEALDRRHWRAAAESAAIMFLVGLGALIVRMKAPGFEQEREWRLVTIATEGPDLSDPHGIEAAKLMKFRQVGSRIVPYLRAEYGPGAAPIVSVRSGPTVERSVARDSIQRLLKGNGYAWEKIKVEKAGVSLRE